jgi:hypothetical protein
MLTVNRYEREAFHNWPWPARDDSSNFKMHVEITHARHNRISIQQKNI